MLFQRKGTALIYDVKEALLPLYEGNEAYIKLEEKAVEKAEEKPKKPTTKKK